MRGRDVFMDSLVAHGVEAIFGNPGTTENPLLDSLHAYPQLPYYVALHESVAVCAAAYYAHASGRTGVANLHVAPGLGNAIGMLYGALKACAPLIVTAGQQDTRMRLRDPVLRHDLVAMAAPVTKWAVEVQNADEFAPIMRRAFSIAHTTPAGPVFVALPINVMEQETTQAATTSGTLHPSTSADPEAIERLAEALLNCRAPVIVAGDDVAVQQANELLTRLAVRIGAAVHVEFLRALLPFAYHHPNFRGRVPFNAAAIRELLAPYDLVLLIGGPFFEEVWFDPVDALPDNAVVTQIETAAQRLAYNFRVDLGLVGHLQPTLGALLSAIDRRATPADAAAAAARNVRLGERRTDEIETFAATVREQSARVPMTPGVALHTLAAALPATAVLVDEGITASQDVPQAFALEQGRDYHGLRGGGIGQGVAGALGVAVAHPERPVVALSGDGSAMYSIQALWTAAHHGLNVLFVILSNREYRVLKHNLDIYRQRFGIRTDRPYPHMDLQHPTLGFVDMAAGMGVPARQVATAEAVTAAVNEALATPGPFLIDILIAGK